MKKKWIVALAALAVVMTAGMTLVGCKDISEPIAMVQRRNGKR